MHDCSNPSMTNRSPHLIELGSRIRQARAELFISQEHLADLCGLHRTYVGGVERGERNISIENLIKIAKALRIDCAELVRKLA